jgi:hypothetical protein
VKYHVNYFCHKKWGRPAQKPEWSCQPKKNYISPLILTSYIFCEVGNRNIRISTFKNLKGESLKRLNFEQFLDSLEARRGYIHLLLVLSGELEHRCADFYSTSRTFPVLGEGVAGSHAWKKLRRLENGKLSISPRHRLGRDF